MPMTKERENFEIQYIGSVDSTQTVSDCIWIAKAHTTMHLTLTCFSISCLHSFVCSICFFSTRKESCH